MSTREAPPRTPRRRGADDITSLFCPSEAASTRVRGPYQDEAVQVMTTALGSTAFPILALPKGSGKTFVANEIVHGFVASGGTVLWLALNWELLVQAASAYAQTFEGATKLARLGGARSPLGTVLREDRAGSVQYTTLHTWYQHKTDPQLKPERVGLLVIDECHWGFNGTMGAALLRQYQRHTPILGLSATPRQVKVASGADPARIVYQKTLGELEGTYLATPRLETLRTHANFRPKLVTADVSQASLCDLASNQHRNELIRRPLLAGAQGHKHEYRIVEPTDKLARHGDVVSRAHKLSSAAGPEGKRGGRSTAPRIHRPAPRHPKFLRLVAPLDLAGLTYVEGQTFGVEVEFTSPLGAPDRTGLVYRTSKWMEVAHSILRAIEGVATHPVDRVPRNYHQVADTRKWRVEFDRSAGWEVVSPILSNQSGFTELANVLSALNALLEESDDLHINYRTGLHVTLGSGFTDDKQVRGLVRLAQVLEPGLFTLVAPSRLYEFHDGHYDLHRHNKYCRPLRRLETDVDELGLSSFRTPDTSIRYRTVNLSHVGRDDQHIEIRLHNGTTEYPVVLGWISLWMTLFNHARFRWPEHGSELPIFPGGDVVIAPEQARAEDIFALLEEVDVHLDPRLRTILARRRSHLLERWKKVIPRRVQSWRRWWWSEEPSADLELREAGANR